MDFEDDMENTIVLLDKTLGKKESKCIQEKIYKRVRDYMTNPCPTPEEKASWEHDLLFKPWYWLGVRKVFDEFFVPTDNPSEETKRSYQDILKRCPSLREKHEARQREKELAAKKDESKVAVS